MLPIVLGVNDFFLSLLSGLPLDSGCLSVMGGVSECSFLAVPLVFPVESTRGSGSVNSESAGWCVGPDLATFYRCGLGVTL